MQYYDWAHGFLRPAELSAMLQNSDNCLWFPRKRGNSTIPWNSA